MDVRGGVRSTGNQVLGSGGGGGGGCTTYLSPIAGGDEG